MTTDATAPISNMADVIDSRDVIARVEYLVASWAEATGDDPGDYTLSEDDWSVGLGTDEAAELVALLALAEQSADYASDWQYGETLIRDSYFTEYAQELADDLGCMNVPGGLSWPLTCIDWELAARELQQDYTSVDFDGATYWIR